jgi:hypothetical protein
LPEDDLQVYEEVCPKGKEKLFRWSFIIHDGDTAGECLFENSVLNAENATLFISRHGSVGGAGLQSVLREYKGYGPPK